MLYKRLFFIKEVVFVKIKKLLASLFAVILCLCFSACDNPPEIVLDNQGRVTLDSAKELAQYVVDEHCKVNDYGEYFYYASTTGEGHSELVYSEDDWLLSFNETGSKKDDIKNDIVVYVSSDGTNVCIIGIPGDNPLA